MPWQKNLHKGALFGYKKQVESVLPVQHEISKKVQSDTKTTQFLEKKSKELTQQIQVLKMRTERLQDLQEKNELLLAQSQNFVDHNGELVKILQRKDDQIQDHKKQIEAIDYENSKLKEVINSKNQQIQKILSENYQLKNNSDPVSGQKIPGKYFSLDQPNHNTEKQIEALKRQIDRLNNLNQEKQAVIQNLKLEKQNQLASFIQIMQKQTKIHETKQNELLALIKQLQAPVKKSELKENSQIKENKLYDTLLQKGISDITVQILRSEEIKTLAELKLMRDQDFRVLGIKMGEVLRIKSINL